MTVKELKKTLENKNENLQVFIRQTNDEFEYSLLEFTKVDTIDFFIEEEDGVLGNAPEECLILTDEI